MSRTDEEKYTIPPPTMPPEQGLRSSKGAMDFGVQIGQYVFHRGPTEWLLDRIPNQLSGPVRNIVAKGFREIGKRTLKPESELQDAMNKKLFMNTVDEKTGHPIMAEVEDGYVKSLFPKGEEEKWPTQLVICAKDVRPDPAALRQAMLNLPEIVGDVIGERPDVVQDFDATAQDRIVVLGAFNTNDDILQNSAAVLERGQKIIRNPDSVEGISDAALRAGDAILAAMTLREDKGTTVLRDDAPDIMRHVMTHGYSQGGNIATDTFRHVRHELMSGSYEIALDDKGSQTTTAADKQLVGELLGNSYIYTIAAADPAYHKNDLMSLPPRDNTRSDGDLVISAAVGTNRKQSNYQTQWSQNEPFIERNDRLLETIGPRKKLFGLLEPRGKGYHSMLGHGDDEYRNSVVDQAGDALKERFLPRFKGQAVASDITFSNNRITLNFERGTPIETMRQTSQNIANTLAKNGLTIETDLHPHTPYQLDIRGKSDEATIGILRDTLKEQGVHPSGEVNIALNADIAKEWMLRRLTKLPDAEVTIDTNENGPTLHIFPAGKGNEAGQHVFGMASKGLERIHLKPNRESKQEDGSFNIPLQDVVNAIKKHQHRDLVEEHSR